MFQNNNFSDLFKNMMENGMGFFKTPTGLDMGNLTSMQRRNMETLAAANQAVSESFQSIARRQAEIVQSNTNDAFSFAKELFSSQNTEHGVANSTNFVKHMFKNATNNMRELTEIMTKSGSEVYDLITKRVAENFSECVDCSPCNQTTSKKKSAA